MNIIKFFNMDAVVGLAVIIVLGVFIYTFYKYILPVYNTSNTNVGLFNKFKLRLSLIKLSSVGTVSTIVNSSNPSNSSTVVDLTDDELNSLLEVVFREIGNSNLISLELLQSFGLHTPTVIAYLKALGYIIF
jgi:hypothetical protein